MVLRSFINPTEKIPEALVENDEFVKRTKEETERITELAIKVANNYKDMFQNIWI
jgi:tetrahydromethanopterin S-methyltransferase subunit G